MTDFPRGTPESFSEPGTQPPAADAPADYSVPDETTMTAPPNAAAEPLDADFPTYEAEWYDVASSAPSAMTAQGGWEEGLTEDPLAPVATDRYDSLYDKTDPPEAVDRIPLDGDNEARIEAIMSTAEWLGPRLSELRYPPTATGLLEVAGERQNDPDNLASELSSGWLVSAGSGVYDITRLKADDEPEPEEAADSVEEEGAAPAEESAGRPASPVRQWTSAVVLSPVGRLLTAFNTQPEDSTRPWSLGPDPFLSSLDSKHLAARDLIAALVPDGISVEYRTSAAIAGALNRLLAAAPLSREELDERFPQRPTMTE